MIAWAMKKITILNSKTVIRKEAVGYNFNSGKNKTFVIAGKKSSTAQTYAKKNGFRFLNNTAAVRTAKMTGSAQNKNHTSWKNIHDPGSDRAVLQRREDSFPFLGSQDRYGKFQRCCKGNPKRDGRDHRAERSEKTDL